MPVVPSVVDVDALMAEAAQRAGSDDFGESSTVEALRLLVTSCAHRGALSEVGWRVLRRIGLRHLRNRVAVRAFLRAHPDIGTTSLGRPIVVTGMPRTGTTVLHELLALDAAHRPLRLWEALLPVPAASAAERDRRIDQARQWLERFYGAVPDFVRIHALRPDGPEECDALLQNAFASHHFDDMFDAPAYSEWLATASLDDAYSFYAAQLRILAAADAERGIWVLKSPIHLGHLDALLRVLPDAVVVQCHRDPLEAVPSYASLMATLRRAYSAHVDPGEVGRQALHRCAGVIDRAMQTREIATSGCFIDVAYAEVVRDPVAVVRAVYVAAGGALGARLEERMREWLHRNPRGARGRHEYDAAAFGIDATTIRHALGPYLERYEAQLRWT